MIIDQFLKSIGVKDVTELNSEEKETLKQWEQSLSGRKLTDEDVATFLKDELDSAVSRLTEVDIGKEAEIFRKVEVRFIKKIQSFLNMPLIEKSMTEKGIESMM